MTQQSEDELVERALESVRAKIAPQHIPHAWREIMYGLAADVARREAGEIEKALVTESRRACAGGCGESGRLVRVGVNRMYGASLRVIRARHAAEGLGWKSSFATGGEPSGPHVEGGSVD